MSSVVKMVFDVDVACELDVNCAIILSNIQYWVFKNATNKKHLYDGRYWTYNSASAYNDQFKWLTERQIRTCVNKLIESGYVLDGNYNANNWDRTKWYGLTNKSAVKDLAICIVTDMSNASDQNDKCILPNGNIDVTNTSVRSYKSVNSYKEHIIITDENTNVSDTPLSEIEVNNPEVIASNTAVPDMPIDYMKANHMMLFNDAKMKASKHVREDWSRVEEYFNSVVLRDGIEYDGKKLYGRLLGLINNWKKDAAVTSEPKRKILK